MLSFTPHIKLKYHSNVCAILRWRIERKNKRNKHWLYSCSSRTAASRVFQVWTLTHTITADFTQLNIFSFFWMRIKRRKTRVRSKRTRFARTIFSVTSESLEICSMSSVYLAHFTLNQSYNFTQIHIRMTLISRYRSILIWAQHNVKNVK